MISWLSRWFKPQGMDKQATLKREAVLRIIPKLEQFIQANISHCDDADFNIPKLFTAYIMFVLGSIYALGEPFDEGQRLAALLIYLQNNSQYEAQGISQILGQTMTFAEEEEWQEIIKQGQLACESWLNGDTKALKAMKALFFSLQSQL